MFDQKKEFFLTNADFLSDWKKDSSATFIPPGFRSRTDLRRRIEKTAHICPREPAQRTLTMLAYLALPVKRKHAAIRVQESGARRTHVGRQAGWRRPLFFGVGDFPKGLVGVLY